MDSLFRPIRKTIIFRNKASPIKAKNFYFAVRILNCGCYDFPGLRLIVEVIDLSIS